MRVSHEVRVALDVYAQLILTEYLCHVLIQPVEVIAHSERKVFNLFIFELRNLFPLVANPLC
jgi:hypothetical protein